MRPSRSTVPGALIRVLALALALVTVLGWALHPVVAQTPNPSDETYTIAKQLNCPVCAGQSLADCPTDTCMQWKQEIRDQLQQGQTPQQVIDYFQSRFGPGVLQEPPKQGAVLILWVLPVIGLAGLAVGALIVLRRISRSTAASVANSPPQGINDEYVARLEEELRETKG